MDAYFTKHQIYSEEQVKVLLDAIEPFEWKEGKARTEYPKRNQELQPQDDEVIEAAAKAHADIIGANASIRALHLLRAVSPPMFNRYKVGDEYKRHNDSPLMTNIRTDLACTTFLSDPDSYDGGELNIEDHYGNVHSYKGKLGECVVYVCGQPHWVSPITRGERISLICWIQSCIKNFSDRHLLGSMGRAIQKIEERALTDPLLREVWTELGSAHAQLFRQWMSI